MHCKIFATSLGSILGWVDDLTFKQDTDRGLPYIDMSQSQDSNSIKVFDACYITSRPSITEEVMESNQSIHDIEGPMITEYIPIRPNVNQYLTFIDLNLDNVIYSYPVLNSDEDNIKGYINKLMGRMPSINASEN